MSQYIASEVLSTSTIMERRHKAKKTGKLSLKFVDALLTLRDIADSFTAPSLLESKYSTFLAFKIIGNNQICKSASNSDKSIKVCIINSIGEFNLYSNLGQTTRDGYLSNNFSHFYIATHLNIIRPL